MTLRGLLLADGPSDMPLARHLAWLCADLGADMQVTAIDPRLMVGAGKTVEGRARFVQRQRMLFDCLFVHRDAENQPPDSRRREVTAGARAAGLDGPVVAVVPIRMTEAWLLLDEEAIRRVAGRPSGRMPLGLPARHEVERVSNPKRVLMEALIVASGTTGRRRAQFERDFGRHRARLLEWLDPQGSVTTLVAWRQLRVDIDAALRLIDASPP